MELTVRGWVVDRGVAAVDGGRQAGGQVTRGGRGFAPGHSGRGSGGGGAAVVVEDGHAHHALGSVRHVRRFQFRRKLPLPLVAPVLEPDLHLGLGQVEGGCQTSPLRTGQVPLHVKCRLKLEHLAPAEHSSRLLLAPVLIVDVVAVGPHQAVSTVVHGHVIASIVLGVALHVALNLHGVVPVQFVVLVVRRDRAGHPVRGAAAHRPGRHLVRRRRTVGTLADLAGGGHQPL